LRHVVITSVTRDDLPDGGAEYFHSCVQAVRRRTGATVEVLTPDFLGNTAAIDRVVIRARSLRQLNCAGVRDDASGKTAAFQLDPLQSLESDESPSPSEKGEN
jgi:lipoate synthase